MTEFVKTLHGEYVKTDKIVSFAKRASSFNIDSKLKVIVSIYIKCCNDDTYTIFGGEKCVEKETTKLMTPNRAKFEVLKERLDVAVRNYIYDITDLEEMEEIHEGIRIIDAERIDRAMEACLDSIDPFWDLTNEWETKTEV